MACHFPTTHPCPQAADGDCYYHTKVRAGLLEPLDAILTPAELEATMDGRFRGDGRRLDAYVTEVTGR